MCVSGWVGVGDLVGVSDWVTVSDSGGVNDWVGVSNWEGVGVWDLIFNWILCLFPGRFGPISSTCSCLE